MLIILRHMHITKFVFWMWVSRMLRQTVYPPLDGLYQLEDFRLSFGLGSTQRSLWGCLYTALYGSKISFCWGNRMPSQCLTFSEPADHLLGFLTQHAFYHRSHLPWILNSPCSSQSKINSLDGRHHKVVFTCTSLLSYDSPYLIVANLATGRILWNVTQPSFHFLLYNLFSYTDFKYSA